MSPSTPSGSLGAELVPAPPRVGPQFPVLDTLRFVGALCVLTTHVAFWSNSYTGHGVWGTVLARLDVGVALFFVLSGFLLARPWMASEPGRRPATRPYLWRRLLRIAPLYLVTVVLALSLIGDNRGLGAGRWTRSLLMIDTFTESSLPAGLTHMWSLAVEVCFYLVLPLLMAVLVGRRALSVPRVITGIVVMLAVSVWWYLRGAVLVGSRGLGSDGLVLQWLPGYLGWFALGLLLALAHTVHQQGRSAWLTAPLRRLARQPGSCWALVAGLLLVAATPIAGPSMLESSTPAESVTKSLLYAAIGGLVVLTGVFADPDSRYARALSHPAGRRLGYVSFGIFCLHLPILHLVIATTGWQLFATPLLGLWAVTLLGSLVAAELSYRLVERPALRLRGLAGRRSRGRRNRGTRRSDPTTSSAANGTTIT